MKKGFTLIEVILGIFLISLIAMVFIPMVSFSFKNIIYSQKFTKDLYKDQEFVENEMEIWQELEPTDPNTTDTINVFGVNIKGHKIGLVTPTSGDVNIFLPQRLTPDDIPVIKFPPIVKVRNNNVNITPQLTHINLIKDPLSTDTITLWVNEVEITDTTKQFFLMNVYRWYLTKESKELDKLHVDYNKVVTNNTNDYTILKEWNEARTTVSLPDSESFKFIPNIKLDYNIVDFAYLKTAIPGLVDEDMINRFGNRYIQYGVTPFSEAGRIGAEEFSNAIYIRAPRIEIKEAEFLEGEINNLKIEFNNNISDEMSIEQFELHPSLGAIITVLRDEDEHNVVLVEYTNPVSQSNDLEGNYLHRGAVKDDKYGAISIWYNNEIEGVFKIKKID